MRPIAIPIVHTAACEIDKLEALGNRVDVPTLSIDAPIPAFIAAQTRRAKVRSLDKTQEFRALKSWGIQISHAQ